MPTGFTDMVRDNESVTLRQFILRCVGFREGLDLDAPIPEEIAPNSLHYQGELEIAKKQLERARFMTEAEIQQQVEGEYDEALRAYSKHLTSTAAAMGRYLSMRNQVKAWQVPPVLANLRTFMLNQLEQGISDDCSVVYSAPPKRQTSQEYVGKLIEYAERNIQTYTQKIETETQEAREKIEWIKALRENLPKE